MHQTHDLGPHTPAPHRSNPTTPSDTARTEYSYSPRNVKHPTKGSARSTILQPDMAFEICPASQTDAPALTEAFLAAFSDDFNQTMFPPTADVRAWVAENLFTSTNQQETILKIADPENPSIVAAFAKWIRPGEAHADRESGGIEWPASSDAALCSSFFGTMERHHGELMGERPHYCMFFFFFSQPLLLVFPFRGFPHCSETRLTQDRS